MKRRLRLRFKLRPTSLFSLACAAIIVLWAVVACYNSVWARLFMIASLIGCWLLYHQGLRGRMAVENLADALICQAGYAAHQHVTEQGASASLLQPGRALSGVPDE